MFWNASSCRIYWATSLSLSLSRSLGEVAGFSRKVLAVTGPEEASASRPGNGLGSNGLSGLGSRNGLSGLDSNGLKSKTDWIELGLLVKRVGLGWFGQNIFGSV